MSTPTPGPQRNPNALPPGSRLGEFELRGVLGVGGFGIVYLAFDHALEREVAVKEYMPASLAGRTATMQVSLRSQSDEETFALGLKSFVNEARLLARFDHPSLLKVLRFWEANGTAYMAMPVMRGRTVKQVRAAMSAPPDEAWLRALLAPLLGAIEKLHAEGVYHRDIAPDNIQLEPDGHPVLLDFGAARRVIGDKSQTLTTILKPAYAPIEQYAEAGSVRQGPWTDIYSLGATLHYLLLGRPPPPATARAVHDDASWLSTAACPGCSEAFLRCIDWMLAPRPADRPQNVAALRKVLNGHAAAPLCQVDTPPPAPWEATVVLAPPEPAPASAAATATATAAATDETTLAPQSRSAPSDFEAPPSSDFAAPSAAVPLVTLRPAPARSKWLPAGIGIGVVAAAAAALSLWPRQPVGTPAALAASATAPGGAASSLAPASVAAPSVALAVPAPPPTSQAGPESAIVSVVAPGARLAAPANSPEGRCSGRGPLARHACLRRECLRPGLRSHADCLALNKEAPRSLE